MPSELICPGCRGQIEEHVNSNGGGSRYCVDGCGYYEELPPGALEVKRGGRVDPPTPPRPKKKKKV